ncbi:origin recognition complex subunit 2 isoform X2 [Poecilia latipinna]|nr:PREDICTED: origin recognition complex subunit 2 isoform X2 [Poecilia latipinna]
MTQQPEMSVLEVKFVGDGDVQEHIVDKHEGVQNGAGSVQRLVKFKSPAGQKGHVEDEQLDQEENGVYDQQGYIRVLGTENNGEDEDGLSRVAGASIFTFQKNRRGNSMANTASSLARTPGKSVSLGPAEPCTPTRTGRHHKGEIRTPQRIKKVRFVSTTPHRLRKRLTTPSLRSDSDSELSPSDSEEDGEEEEEKEEEDRLKEKLKINKEEKEIHKNYRTPSKGSSAALFKTPAKKSKNTPEPVNQPAMTEEYFEAHGSSKILTSDRTLERLHTPKLDRETLAHLLEGKPSCYSKEIQELHDKHRQHFTKWMLQLQLGFSVLVYGLGSKKTLLEDFRVSHLSQEIHLVVNGFFPSITLKSILNALTCEVLEHQGTFSTPSDQIHFIAQTLKDSPDLHIYLLIHNIDGPMLRGEKTQSALGQLAALPNLHLVASIDHINAPLVWDQFKQSQFNWLWWECVTFQHYTEETSYENSLLVQQTGALALSSLTHVLRSLTPNARGIFKLLGKFQLENKDNPSYSGLSFQDFYQRCREAFLVNSDLTLRTQLTEFRDHKLIRTRKGADGVEYLIVAVETNTLIDFLENEDDD